MSMSLRQVHTTGMDIKQVLNAEAVLTLGKDMTFRDYAQGAFRMRGIGQGQHIELIKLLSARGAVLDAKGKSGLTALQEAKQAEVQTEAFGSEVPATFDWDDFEQLEYEVQHRVNISLALDEEVTSLRSVFNPDHLALEMRNYNGFALFGMGGRANSALARRAPTTSGTKPDRRPAFST